VKRHRPDHVFVAYGDHMPMAPLVTTRSERDLGMNRSQVDAMFLQSGEVAYLRHLRLRRRIRARLGLMGMHRLPFGRLIFMDAIVHDWMKDHCPSLSRRCVLLPDPVSPVRRYDKATARDMLGIASDGRLISCVGVLDQRKGVDEFVRSFAAAPLAGNDRLLLAGRASPDVAAALGQATARVGQGRIISINRILTGEELDLAVSAADLVATTYRCPMHLGSASVLIRAAAAQRPVLASEEGWLGHMTRAHSLGWIYPTLPADRPGSIAKCLRDSAGYVSGEQAAEFARFHSVDRFCQVVAAPFRGAPVGSGGAESLSCAAIAGDRFAEHERPSRAGPVVPRSAAVESFDAVPVPATHRSGQ
jgi:glycosyltransferase involved in cell wall biosynthesis